VVASQASHLSIKKSARILGLTYEEIPTNSKGQIDAEQLNNISDACLVLTAGTTATGSIDSLKLAGQAKWTHVDAAWAGPLCLSPSHTHLLEGIEKADSVAVSAHKWFFQPKDSALVMFRDPKKANSEISFGSGYLTSPNIGIQGSRGASAIPLLATLIAWGRDGLVERIDRTMSMAAKLAENLHKNKGITLWALPTTGVTVFRPLSCMTEELHKRLPEGMFSTCLLDDKTWLRSVAANPLANIDEIISTINDEIN
jgi:L-2,4-diaminobutyrate decarboxylase